MKKITLYIILFLNLTFTYSYSNNKLYEKIDLFSEVLEKIKEDYVDEVDQSEVMDSAINGVLQSLDPYSAYMSPDLFKEMQTDTRGEFGGLGKRGPNPILLLPIIGARPEALASKNS